MMEFVSWDSDIPNIWKNNPIVPNHPPFQYVLDDATTDWQAFEF
jgi:hypothetical protein